MQRLGDAETGEVLRFLEGRALIQYGRCCRRARLLTADGAADAAGLGPRLWRALCLVQGYRQAGTRSRGFALWSAVYRCNLCVECTSPANVFINDRALDWPNRRFGVCSSCLKSNVWLRIAKRPEIHGASQLRATLFRIATVRRELGLATHLPHSKKNAAKAGAKSALPGTS
ncbi:hypothetical protein M885DRAFT_507004 [Pelagophyceae sp. CCMP2097]|nr:hypothetical protein M885DRAFT_507004 [Pelagophyceae sp. CCMP2097]